MFSRSKPVVIDYYSRSRSRWRVPKWLILLLVGIAAGAAGVIAVQERLLPPRLSADASAKLQTSFEQAERERVRLATEVDTLTKRLEIEQADKARAASELAASRQEVERLRGDVAFVAAALPPDPRAGAVEVRAARFFAQRGALVYDVALARDRATGGRPSSGVLQFAVSGDGARGGDTTQQLKPIPISISDHLVVRGSLPLPEGFTPRQATIKVLDRVDGKLLGTRVMLVK